MPTSPKKFDPAAKLSDEKALKLIRDIVDHGTIIPSHHSDTRSNTRKFTDQDIIYILETGSLIGKEFEPKFNNWKYKIEGSDLDGEDGIVVTAIISSNSILIITVY